jgi:ppGpp synthetase/RelA/SpoT-type nucleotidyltranferase
MPLLARAKFLKKYGISPVSFSKSKLKWADLEETFELHSASLSKLQTTANYIADRLRELDEVHSLKIRIKDPEHLIEKIIRKTLAREIKGIKPDNYTDRIGDLIGIRALHLFKEDWLKIHNFIVGTWDLAEKPTANVRRGDPEELIQSLVNKGCEIYEHKFGYRSIHYTVKSHPDKELFVAELQVRTIFEEGWSEIDHRIRYPYDVKNAIFGQFLVVFNRLAGSADEMGSFVKFLKTELEVLEEGHAKLVDQLKTQIEKLKITKDQKSFLRKGVRTLEGPLKTPTADRVSFGGTLPLVPKDWTISGLTRPFDFHVIEPLTFKTSQVDDIKILEPKRATSKPRKKTSKRVSGKHK